MPKRAPAIAELFDVPSRFLRSVHLERDFDDISALDQYVVTPPMAEAFARIADGLRRDSGRRAWRITGDYGVGKSSFALVLAHLLNSRSSRRVSRIAESIDWPGSQGRLPVMWPVLITGSREGLSAALARGIGDAMRRRAPNRGRAPKALTSLIAQAQRAESRGDTADLARLIDSTRDLAATDGAGLLLVIDELGKCLEYASQFPDREDVFILQRLAEAAARGGSRPFLVLGLLHQGFHAYAERLPTVSRHEWDKVAGRFDEIVFDQPLAHTAALVAGALNLDARRLPTPVRDAARVAGLATAETGWLGGATTGAATLDVARLYPLHPTLLPVLVRFFGRFGQHERSLFGFLLSSEPFGLQRFAAQRVAADRWFGLADFYDYVRSAFGHRLAGASYRNQWLRLITTIDATTKLSPHEERILKAIAVLNLLDAEDLLANDRAIRAAFAPTRAADTDSALRQLVDRGVLFRRGTNGYRLWPLSSVNLETAFQSASRAIGHVETVAGSLGPFLDREPVLARRHYIERGTLRYFELRYVLAPKLADPLETSNEADGHVFVALADEERDRSAAIEAAVRSPFRDRPDVIVAVIRPLIGLAPELQDVRCWQWVLDNTPELTDDAYAAAEAKRQTVAARRTLALRLAALVGLRSGTAAEVAWFRAGKAVQWPDRGGLSALVSSVCDELYPKAPRVSNELLNRNTLSSAAAAARMRLIEGLFEAADKPLLGIDPAKAPPEKSMYLSVIQKGGLHIKNGDVFALREPRPGKDPLNLSPALTWLVGQVESARGNRVSVADLMTGLRSRPYGVRAGVVPLLLAIVLRTRAHELAVYEQGTFLHKFGPSDFLRLTKVPVHFEIQHCRVEGVRLEVFNQLAAVFASGVNKRNADLLDVVRPLCEFAAQLPEYTRRINSLSEQAVRVREALLSAREPVTLLFRDLPEACGMGFFEPDQPTAPKLARRFVSGLHDAIGELRGAYAELLDRIVRCVAEALGEDRKNLNRAALATRAAQVSLAVREPRLRAFTLRLRDPGLSDDAWAEALASFVLSKPPSRWSGGDEARFQQDVTDLAGRFHRVESTAFLGDGASGASDAIRLNLTRGDGEDLVRVIEARADDEQVSRVAVAVSDLLPQDRHVRLDVLTRLLWRELEAVTEDQVLKSSKSSQVDS